MLTKPNLAASIQRLVLEAFEDGTLSREETKMIMVGPNARGDVLHLWGSREWEDYAEPSEGDEFANVSLAAWLDEMDVAQRETWAQEASGAPKTPPRRGLITHAYPAVDTVVAQKLDALHEVVVGALRLVATSDAFANWDRVLGFFVSGLSASGYADIAAFAHADGGGELLPIREDRPPSMSIYSVGTLTERGITMFYPEGEKDGLDDESDADAAWASFAFNDMEMVRFDQDDGDTIIRMKDELFDRTFCHGHTHEEWGGPNNDEVDRMIQAHMKTRPELIFDLGCFPSVDDTGAVEAWMGRYVSCNLSQASGVVTRIANSQGLDSVSEFLDRLPADASDRESALARFADKLLAEHRFEESLAIIEALDGKNRVSEAKEELRCLLALGRNDDCLQRIEALLAEEERSENHIAPWKAIALTNLGRAREAIELIEPLLEGKQRHVNEGDCLYALAHAHKDADLEAAEALAFRAMARGRPPADFAMIDFAHCPKIRDVFAHRQKLDAAGERFDAELTARTVRTAATPLGDDGKARPSEQQWTLGSQLDVEGVSRLSRIIVGERFAYAPAQKNGLVVFDLENPESPTIAARLESDTSFESAALAGDVLYIADYSWGLRVLDVSDPAAPRDIGTAPRYFNRNHAELAVGEGFAATGGSCTMDLYDLSDPSAPALASALELGMKRGNRGGVNALAARGKTLFVAAGGTGLVIVDVSAPSTPKVIGQLALDSDFYARSISVVGDTAFLGDSSNTWVVDISTVKTPTSLGVIPRGFDGAGPVRVHQSIMGFDDDGEVWTLDPECFEVTDVAKRVDTSEDEREVEGLGDAIAVGDLVLTVIGSKLSTFCRQPRSTASGGGLAKPRRIRELESAVSKWVIAQVVAAGEECPDAPLGAVQLRMWGARIDLDFAGPCSLLELETRFPDEGYPSAETTVPEFLAAGESAIGVSSDAAPEGLRGKEEQAYSQAVSKLWDEVLGKVMANVQQSPELAELASGRVLFCTGVNGATKVVGLRLDDAKPWQPKRTEFRERVIKSIEEMLTSYDSYKYIEIVEAKARHDETTRREVFRLAHLNTWSALRIVASLKDLDEEATIAAFVAASAVELEPRVIKMLAEKIERPEVRAIFDRAYEDSDASVKIAAAKLLGRCDDDAIVDVVRTLLEDESGDYAEAELAAEAMEHMQTRVPDLLSSLRAWVARAGDWENRLPVIAKYLFKAGEPVLPEMLKKQASREMRDEQYHAMKMGIRALDTDWSQNDACESMRLWTGKALADRVIALRGNDDHSASFYPPESEMEPHPASWSYLLASAWPHLEAADCLDWFVDGLIERARPGLEYEADRRLLLTILNKLFAAQDMAAVARVAKAILSAGNDVYEESIQRSLRKKYYLARLQSGWDLLRERNLVQARHVADAALEDEPSDGQVLFFDARLVWLERSIEDAIETVSGHLKKIGKDPLGRGRLLNLVGCGLDELGRLEESLSWFEKAAQAHPEDPMYLANVAEVHHRLGNMSEALRYAKNALAQGADSEYAKKILAELKQ